MLRKQMAERAREELRREYEPVRALRWSDLGLTREESEEAWKRLLDPATPSTYELWSLTSSAATRR